ncbi:MAG: zf-TFIIB domain-containing protein [Candidatus Fermentibacteraceae bacterium]
MSRTCPRCGVPLRPEELHRESVDRCPECQGMFFDAGELAHISRLTAILNRIELGEPEIDCPERERPPITCPADGTGMEVRRAAGVEVDRCPSCGGYWLDGGELAELYLVEQHIRANLSLYLRLGSR